MLATYVVARLSALTFAEATAAMRGALAAELQAAPDDPVLALALGKTALETGRWQSIWNYNWGNIKCGDTYAGSYCCYACNEVLAGVTTWFRPEGQLDRKGGNVVGQRWDVPPGHPQTRFRAYASAVEGASGYISFVANGRYRDAWQRLLAGDAAGYVHALKQKGYFTADEEGYRKSVVSLQREFIAKLAQLPAPEVVLPSVEDIQNMIAPDPDALLRAEATGAAADALFDRLGDAQRSAIAELSDDEEAVTPKPGVA